MTALIIALPQEAEGIEGYSVYLSGCGKVNATIATMKAIHDGHNLIINYGSAGSVSDVIGLVEVTGYVDRDMDAIALGCELGQTPFEEGVLIGKKVWCVEVEITLQHQNLRFNAILLTWKLMPLLKLVLKKK